MEILLPILLELIASEVWDKVKERYAKPDPTWGEDAVRLLEPDWAGPSRRRSEMALRDG